MVDRLTVDQVSITGEQPGFVDEQSLIRAAIKKSVLPRRQHGAAVAHIGPFRSRAQPYKTVIGQSVSLRDAEAPRFHHRGRCDDRGATGRPSAASDVPLGTAATASAFSA